MIWPVVGRQICLLLLSLVSLVGSLRADITFPPAELNLIGISEIGSHCKVHWQTARDPGVISYDLYRQSVTGGDWVKVNASPVVATNSLAGATYAVLDQVARLGQPGVYRLVQTDQSGHTVILGPFHLTPVAETEPKAIAVVGQIVAGSTSPTQPIPTMVAHGIYSLPELNGSTFVKITTTNFGLQFIAAANLANLLGQPLSAIQAGIAKGVFQLTTAGQPVNWLATPDSNNIYFYAEAHRDNYSTNNIYWLTSLTNSALAFENGQAPAATSADLWYPATQFYSANVIYASSLPLGAEDDPWMWQLLVSGIPGFNTADDFAVVDHLSQGSDRAAQLALHLWGGVAASHGVQINVNSANMAGQRAWSGLVPTNFSISIPSAWLGNGSNDFTLLALPNGTSPRSQWYLNSYTFTYPRTYTAVNGLIDCTANGNALITISGFTDTNVTLLDVTQPKAPLLVTNVTFTPGTVGWQLSFAPANPAGHYVAFELGAAAPVDLLALGQVAGFANHSNAADYVIVSPASLLPAATNLAAYRRSTGLKTLIAPLDEVYNEFAYGFPTPHAIQSLVATGWTNWSTPPHYLVLLGKGTYDFLNVLNQSNNLTPPLMVSTPYGLFASDSLMGDVYGTGVPEVAVGRFSGLTTNDIMGLVEKIQAYEDSIPMANPQALLIADVPDSAGDFQNDIAQTDAVLTNKFTDTILFSTNASMAGPLHSQILTNWNLGVDFVNYAGHGAIGQFGTAGYLTSADATNSLTKCPRLPVVTAMTCVSGQYSQPSGNCLGETLLQPASGGGIAFFGPTGLSLSGEASELNVRLTALLRANAQLGLGDMIRQAVADHVTQDLPSVPVWIYNLLGDPALHYSVPRNLVPLVINSYAGGTLAWSGGLPPYQVETTSSLFNGPWQPVGGTLLGTQTSVTNTLPVGFFRVRGNQ